MLKLRPAAESAVRAASPSADWEHLQAPALAGSEPRTHKGEYVAAILMVGMIVLLISGFATSWSVLIWTGAAGLVLTMLLGPLLAKQWGPFGTPQWTNLGSYHFWFWRR